MTQIYLASASPRRREILKQLKIPFKRIQSTYEENNKSSLHPRKLVVHHARQKALHARAPKNGIVLAADTLVWRKGKIFGKPRHFKEAVQMLQSLAGRAHSVYTGVAILDKSTGMIQSGCERTQVFMKPLSESEIREYFKKAHPLDKAGAYAIQIQPSIVRRIKGSYSNVVGLPVELLKKLLRSGRLSLGNSRRSRSGR